MNLFRAAIPAIALLSLAAVFVAGCNTDRTKIGDIDNHPEKFVGRDVRVAGQVIRVWDLPLGVANLAAYRLDDGTGQIWVVTHAGAPARGERIGLKGIAEPVAAYNRSFLQGVFGDYIEEQRRKTF